MSEKTPAYLLFVPMGLGVRLHRDLDAVAKEMKVYFGMIEHGDSLSIKRFDMDDAEFQRCIDSDGWLKKDTDRT